MGRSHFARAVLCVKEHLVFVWLAARFLTSQEFFWREIKGKLGITRSTMAISVFTFFRFLYGAAAGHRADWCRSALPFVPLELQSSRSLSVNKAF